MYNSRLFADVLHDVDLTAFGPASRGNIVTQHPKRRPHSLARRNLDAGFEPSVGLREPTLSLEPGRCIFPRNVIVAFVTLLARDDNEIPVLDVRVFSSIRIGLEFLIAPAPAAQFVSPLGRVGKRAVGTV